MPAPDWLRSLRAALSRVVAAKPRRRPVSPQAALVERMEDRSS